MAQHIAVRAQNLSKQFALAEARGRHDTLRDEVTEGLRGLFRRQDRSRLSRKSFWALRDVSFDVKQGDVVGIIGRNGAGKSTLLKVLSRITEPTSGQAEIFGRVGSLLEVGTGFDRELSGRDNIYLSGAILGMKKREIDRKFDEIVAFAEVERFLTTPVKRYSSGMYLRLAFAVAAHLEPEILVLDEVLAVGDAQFQRRCLGKMEEVAGKGRTVLFVSHNMAAIARFCNSCIWLDQGTVREIGNPEEVVAKYLSTGIDETGEVRYPDNGTAPGSEYVRLLAVRIRSGNGEITSSPDSREPMHLEIEYRLLRNAPALRVGMTLIGCEGSVLLSTKDRDSIPEKFPRTAGRYVSRCEIPGHFLNYGQYFITVGADFPMIQNHFLVDRVLSLRVERVGGTSGHIPDGRAGLLRVTLPWDVQNVHDNHEIAEALHGPSFAH
jgi:lipopolysaccharide transport system ATP-binding protein